MKIAIAQINNIVGDLKGNSDKILEYYHNSEADLVVFPEMSLIGYPPEDLILSPYFRKKSEEAINRIISYIGDKAAIIGHISEQNGKIYNVASFIHNQKIIYVAGKYHLPNYGVFDEQRIFSPCEHPPEIISYMEKKIGLIICEDLWHPDIAANLANNGAELLIAINSSPYERGKIRKRHEIAAKRTQENNLPLIYVNQVGGQDELVFDGNSFIMDQSGNIFCQLEHAKEQLEVIDYPFIESRGAYLPEYQEIYEILILGVRDYLAKNGFTRIVLGLSGGIDSALVAVIAVDALGKDNVHLVMLPSEFTSKESMEDASLIAENLGVRYDIIPINGVFKELKQDLTAIFSGKKEDVTEENMQSRIRGLILMSISNKFGSLLLTTGNKSEMSTGFATLYGDMCGAFNPIKDLYKTKVFALAKWRNENIPANSCFNKKNIIVERIITKAPSAELAHNQKDEDRLPPYEILDEILEKLIENNLSIEEATEKFGNNLVSKITSLLFIAEYKRKQAPPGIKLTNIGFGKDRRYPISHKFSENIIVMMK